MACAAASAWLALGLPASTAESQGGSLASRARAAGERGSGAARQGDFGTATRAFEESAALWREAGNERERVASLLRQAYAQRAGGLYGDAQRTLAEAAVPVETLDDAVLAAALEAALGDLQIALGPPEEAERRLRHALALAERAGAPAIAAAALNNLGNLHTVREEHAAAREAYTEASDRAAAAGRVDEQARALANEARAWLALDEPDRAEVAAGAALELARGLPDGHRKAYLLLNVGRTFARLPDQAARAVDSFERAARLAGSLGDARAGSYAAGYRGGVYEAAGRTSEALDLTRRALLLAQRARAPESLYLWHWQAGRLLQARGRTAAAIDEYRAAVAVLKDIRYELDIGYGTAASSFRDAVGPVYFELVDLLLRRADDVSDADKYAALLAEARDTVEELKAAELRDYFQDECVDALRSKLQAVESVSESVAVVYPILLPDRTELLLYLPTRLARHTLHDVGAARLTAEVRKLRSLLEKRTTREYLPHAQQLYDWLVAPLEEEPELATIDTLVFVPDGPLRTVPMAALHDGTRFLIEKYALAITPGLSLTDPQPLDRENLQVLLSGVSEGVQGFSPLPNVLSELRRVREHFPQARVLLNSDFKRERLRTTLEAQEFSIVHIASHGEFGASADETFILAWDERVSMTQLSDYVGVLKYREEPLELLTLSACETAAGDDRAALGLAGVAIRAGARSALGTLWNVNDRAASDLVVTFYGELSRAGVSRADALRAAQLEQLRGSHATRHPYYWSPFILISSWL